jgi:hypothetical protein
VQVQTRNDEGELKYFRSVTGAFKYAKLHEDVWKISWAEGHRRVRFIRLNTDAWVYQPILPEVKK